MKPHKSVWRVPVMLALLTASGLLSALISDGLGDVWSWLCLATPLFVASMCVFRSRRA